MLINMVQIIIHTCSNHWCKGSGLQRGMFWDWKIEQLLITTRTEHFGDLLYEYLINLLCKSVKYKYFVSYLYLEKKQLVPRNVHYIQQVYHLCIILRNKCSYIWWFISILTFKKKYIYIYIHIYRIYIICDIPVE